MIYNGRRVSSPMYAHISFFLDCATRVPRMDSVCEIGGGYGALGRLFLTNNYRPVRRYVVVDLPESLFFAEAYLRATLGSDRVHYVESATPIANRTLLDHPVILCPVSRLPALRMIHFDLVINTLSMQEMTDEYVAFYRDWLAAQPANYFYSFNYLMQRAEYLGESPNLFAPRLSPRWVVTLSTCIDGRPNPFSRVLARRCSPLTARWRNWRSAARYFQRPLAISAMYPLLHAADNAHDARFPYRLLVAMSEDFDPIRKEALFLVRRIGELERCRPVLDRTERDRVAAIRSSTEAQVSDAVHARVPPHLVELQQELYPDQPTTASASP
jgi:hypothetical protein